MIGKLTVSLTEEEVKNAILMHVKEVYPNANFEKVNIKVSQLYSQYDVIVGHSVTAEVTE